MDTMDSKLLDDLNAKDDLELRLGDSLDVKASIGLVVITFLAIQTADILSRTPSAAVHVTQLMAAACLGLAAITTVIELWPRTYLLPYPESSGADRLAELRNYYEQHPEIAHDAIEKEFTKNQIDWAKQRIALNHGKNRTKSHLLMGTFILTTAALLVNLITLFSFMQLPF